MNISSSDIATIVHRFSDGLKNIKQWRKIILLKGKRNSNWNKLLRNINI